MCATQLNPLVHSGIIAQHCVLRVSEFIVNTLGSGVKICILLGCEAAGPNPGDKIGKPVIIEQLLYGAPPAEISSGRDLHNRFGGGGGSSYETMNELTIAHTRLNLAHFNHEKAYEETIAAFDEWENNLVVRLAELNTKKESAANIYGNPDAKDDDLVEINAGGKVIVAKRSTLTQNRQTKLEALFSGRWDKKLQRDKHGRIFLDVNPACFRAIVDNLNEATISCEDNPPCSPTVDRDYANSLNCHLEMFGLPPKVKLSDFSIIIKDKCHDHYLHEWLKEDDSRLDIRLLYIGSRDGLNGKDFHRMCDNKGPTITLIETTCGKILGGYSNAHWDTYHSNKAAEKAFLFVLAGADDSLPIRMKLKEAGVPTAIFCVSSHGPAFGSGQDMSVCGLQCRWYVQPSGHSFHPGPLPSGVFTIKEIEVFHVVATKIKQVKPIISSAKHVTRFSADVNTAINAIQHCLSRAENEVVQLEDNFNDEEKFITSIAPDTANVLVSLNVSGATMITNRSTLCVAEDSVLAQQFDESKWTEQGSNVTRVKNWTPDEVNTWAKSIDGLAEDVSIKLYENEITGRELVSLNIDGLKLMGIERVGTLCLILDEIKSLKQKSEEIVTLIEHSPYCFGKILDYLRLKNFLTLGLLDKEPALPKVCASQQHRFEKIVKYYFPGDGSKFILGNKKDEDNLVYN